MKFSKLLVILFFLSLSFDATANITENICKKPEVNGSLEHTNLIAIFFKGGALSDCALYHKERPIGSVFSRDCPEINCRANSAEKIIFKAKTVLKLSEKAKDPRTYSIKDINRVIKGEESINGVIKEWQNFIDLPKNKNFLNYSEVEKYLSVSLELLTKRQVDMLPRNIINSYIQEQRAKAERIRKEAERKRLEQERKEQQLSRKKKKEEQEERQGVNTCIWTLTFDKYYLFLPFRHSNCIWVKLGIPSPIWFIFNIFLIYLIYRIVSYGPKKSKKYSHLEVQEVNKEQKELEDSFFSKKGIN